MADSPVVASYKRRAPAVMGALMHYFPGLDAEGAAAILGNLWAESGLQAINEKNPTVPGSRGGFGWPQWTASRRRDAETFWRERGMDPATDPAQLAFLIFELQGKEKRGITAVMRPGTLDQRTKAFELAFERAGVKNYPERYKGARWALDAYNANPVTVPVDPSKPAPVPVERKWAEQRLAHFEIRAIQKRLDEIGFGHMLGRTGPNKDGVDGAWGPLTAGAIFALQTRAGITADGHYGPETQRALAAGIVDRDTTPPPATDDLITQGITRMFGTLLSFIGPKTLFGLAVSFAAPYAAKYGIGEASLNAIVQDIGLLFAAYGSFDASKKAVARAS
jgi:peptidoglycan hydrolase-like protein with peptidoglycan-binding domain